MMYLCKAVSLAAILTFSAPVAAQTVYFEDNFDGDDMAEEWEIFNPNPDGYLVESGFLTILTADKVPASFGTAENILRLSKPVPKGDWTMTARIRMAPQTMGESIRIGVTKNEKNSLLATFYLTNYNYSLTHLYVSSAKLAKGKNTYFSRNVFSIKARDPEVRSAQYSKAIAAFELRLEKKGRSYISAIRFEPVDPGAEGAIKSEWLTVQKLTSLRSPGDAFSVMFGSDSNDYTPDTGEGLIEIDWIKIETP